MDQFDDNHVGLIVWTYLILKDICMTLTVYCYAWYDDVDK